MKFGAVFFTTGFTRGYQHATPTGLGNCLLFRKMFPYFKNSLHKKCEEFFVLRIFDPAGVVRLVGIMLPPVSLGAINI